MLLDTHIWIWLIEGNSRLRPELLKRIDQDPDSCYVSPISIWEALILAGKGRLDLGRSPEAALRLGLKKAPLREAPLHGEIAFLSQSLRFEHQDPADRFLAATAKFLGVPLATDDLALRNLKWLKTV